MRGGGNQADTVKPKRTLLPILQQSPLIGYPETVAFVPPKESNN